MTRTTLFKSNVTNEDVMEVVNALKGVADIFKLSVTSATSNLFNLDDGELLANVDKLTTKCNGLSVWGTVKDIGVRISPKYYESLNQTQQFMLDNCYAYKLIKAHKNERRYSFTNAYDVLSFFMTLNAYATATATREVTEKVVTAV